MSSLATNKMDMNLPGWRIEQRYSPGVLIGNWSEQRYRFEKGNYDHNSTQRIDFRNFGSHRPDVSIRRAGATRNEGLNRDLLFTHHEGNRFSSNLVSSYDEFMNGRWRENPVASKLRSWDGHRLEWIPEKSDYPLRHEPTNFGLLPEKKRKWKKQMAEESLGDYISTYTYSYKDRPREPVELRCANPIDISSTVHKYNLTNKDLNLREVSRSKIPESVENNLADVSC